jgi:phosphoglycolate phosphatase
VQSPALVCFDFDGTLADSWPIAREVFDLVVARFGLRAPDDAELAMLRTLGTREQLAWLGVSALTLPRLLRFARAELAERRAAMSLVAGMEGVLDALHARGVPVAIVSSNSERTVRAVLGTTRAARLAAYRCGVGLFGKAPRLRGVCRALGVPVAQAALVGDEPRDVDAARAAGMTMVAVGWGYAAPSTLVGADHNCGSVRELAAVLGVDGDA